MNPEIKSLFVNCFMVFQVLPLCIAGDLPETPATASRTLRITWGGTKTTTVEFYILSFTRTPDKNALTRWSAVLQTTGSVSEAQ